MTSECPRYAGLLQLIHTDLSGEGAVGLVEDILSRDFDTLAEVFAGEKEIERWWSDDNFCSASRSAYAP
jgi:hypothetical protein